ncbi:MAG: chemotaxis protein CheX [Acidobacteria bacterium]|nr:chemotaxis protein CheX [Acidobacteriota bacterium]
MRLELVKAFINITKEIFTEVLNSEVATGPLTLESQPRVDSKVVTLVDLSGDVAGKIILQMDFSTATSMTSRMTGLSNSSRTMIASCIAELTGMTVGRAISWINDQSWNIHMTPPIVTIETKWKLAPQEVETLVFSLKTACGEVMLNVSLVDKL